MGPSYRGRTRRSRSPVPGTISMSVPLSFRNARAYCRSSAPTPTKAISTRLAKGMSRSQILGSPGRDRNRFDPVSRDDRLGVGADAAKLALGVESAQARKDREQRALVPGVQDPKWPKKLTFRGSCVRDRTSMRSAGSDLRSLSFRAGLSCLVRGAGWCCAAGTVLGTHVSRLIFWAFCLSAGRLVVPTVEPEQARSCR